MNVAESLTCPRCRGPVRNTPDPVSGTVRCDACGTRFDPRQGDTSAAVPSTNTLQALAQDAWQPAAGDTVGPYELISELGRGGMSTVWEARQASLDRPVAVKILHAHLARDRDLRRRFLREAEALVQVDHPNVLTVLDQGEDRDRPYLVTALVGRRTLRDELKADKPLAPDRVQAIARDVLAGLGHAHQRGLVHRDIKPENLIVAEDGVVSIADFGIAQVHHGLTGHTLTQLTGTNVVMGTVAYMAPEQGEHSATVDARCDLYALGVVCYECLTGNRPVGRFEDPADDLDDLPPTERRAWNHFVLSLLERKPERRPADAAAALALLDAIADSEPTLDAVVEDYDLDIDGRPTDEAVRTVDGELETATRHRWLMRDQQDGWLGGVCGGVGKWTGINANWWRIALIAATVMLGPAFLIAPVAYIIAVLAIPICGTPPYRPKALNRGLAKRPFGWFAGVCALLAERTTIPAALWRILFILTLPVMSWVVYLVLAIVLPGEEQPRFIQQVRRRRHRTRTSKHAASADSAAALPTSDGRNRRYWAWATAGLALAWVFPARLFAAHGVGVDQLLPFFGFALAVAVAALLQSRLRPKDRPRSGAIGGMLLALGCLALFAVAAGYASGNLDLTRSVIGLACWLAIPLGLLAVLRGRYTITSQLIGLGLAIIFSTAVADQVLASGGVPSGGASWFQLIAGVPMLALDYWDGYIGGSVSPIQILGLGLATWWLSSLVLGAIGALFRPKPDEDGQVRPWRTGPLLFGLATICSMIIAGLATPLDPGLAVNGLADSGRFRHPGHDGWTLLVLIAAPALLYLGTRRRLVQVVVDGEVRLEEPVPQRSGGKGLAITITTAGAILVLGFLWLGLAGSQREMPVAVERTVVISDTAAPASTSEAAIPATPVADLWVCSPGGSTYTLHFGTTSQILGQEGSIQVRYQVDYTRGTHDLNTVTFPDGSQVFFNRSNQDEMLTSSTGWSIVVRVETPVEDHASPSRNF